MPRARASTRSRAAESSRPRRTSTTSRSRLWRRIKDPISGARDLEASTTSIRSRRSRRSAYSDSASATSAPRGATAGGVGAAQAARSAKSPKGKVRLCLTVKKIAPAQRPALKISRRAERQTAMRLIRASAIWVNLRSVAFSSSRVCWSTLAQSFRPSSRAQAIRVP